MIAITKKDIVDMVVEEDPPTIKENSWDGATNKSQLFDFARNDSGDLQKEKIENYFLKVEGDGLVESDYSYPVGKIADGKPEYDLEGLQAAFSAAMGSHTGVEHEKLAERAANLAKENFGLEMLTDGMKDVLGIKENSAYATASGDMVIEETTPINDYQKELEATDVAWTPEKAKQDLIEWATSEGKISKKKLMKYFLDVDGGDAQNVDSYRYVVGAIVDTEPQYCLRCLDDSWELASGKRTGVANRTVMKKIIFLKDREGMPLTEEQLEFTERHMSAPINDDEIKLNESILEDASEMGNVAVVPNGDIKLNSALSGSKVIYEDDDVIEVPVVPMREGVFTGADGIPTLKKYEYFGNDAHWLEGQPILRGHTAPTELVTYKHNRIGKLVNVISRPDKKDVVAVARYYKNKLSPEDLTRIKSDVPYDGSIAYTTHTSMTPGEYNGSKYNAVEDGGYHFYHFAELANSKGACSHEEGCGFLLNEAPKPVGDITLKTYKNSLRSANVVQKDTDTFIVKLNSGLIYEAKDVSDAETYAENYAKFGMKLNYNCPDSEKSGSGKGACGGSDKTESKYDKEHAAGIKKFLGSKSKSLSEIASKIRSGDSEISAANDKSKFTVVKTKDGSEHIFKDPKIAKEFADSGSSDSQKYRNKDQEVSGKEKSVPFEKNGQNLLEIENGDLSLPELQKKLEIAIEGNEDLDLIKIIKDDITNRGKKSKTKQNSRLSNSKILTGNNMTDIENVETVEVTPMEDIVQKLNESFEAKLNAAMEDKEEEITSLKDQITALQERLDALLKMQEESEAEIMENKAKEDFEAFTQKLNMAHRKDAQVHYDGFKADGWKYTTAHPEVFKVDVPKMNARGVPEAGEDVSELAKARAELQKTLSGKR